MPASRVRQASDMRRMSVWWTYVANMASKCSFAKKTYSDACAQAQARAELSAATSSLPLD